MLKAVTAVLEEEKANYHIGITYTTNLRFWEYNEKFIEELKASRAQAIELECATLFMASYKRKFTLGALLLVSDLPLNRDQIKTKKSSEFVFENFMPDHIKKGVAILKQSRAMQSKKIKGAYHRNIDM
jgi:AMP nucleosidase